MRNRRGTPRGTDGTGSYLNRRVLIVSPYFPPSTLAGVHRARHLAKHLPAAGWAPSVLCVDEAYHEQRLDPALARLVPSDLDVMKVAAWPASVTRRLGLGEIGIRAYPHLAEGVRRAIETRDPDVVFITGSPYYPMLLSRMIKRRYGKPVVLDFQDPWVSAWGAAQPRLTKRGLSHALALALEPVALRHADFVTSVSDRQNEEMARRHSWLDAGRMAAIPIGGDPDDYRALRDVCGSAPSVLAPGKVNFVYVGAFLPRATGVVAAVFAALARLRTAQPRLADSLRFTFVGTSNQTSGQGNHRVRPLADAAGVGDLVTEIPERIPYLSALATLAHADGILLLGSDEAHYTASKIYPALLSGRPCLGVFHRASSAFDILSRAGGAYVAGFETDEELRELTAELSEHIASLAEHPGRVGPARQAVLDDYSARSIAARYAELFTSLAVVGA